MRFLHDEDDVGPLDQFGGQRILGVVVCPGRRDFDVRPGRKDLFGGRATKFILAAYEQDVFQPDAPSLISARHLSQDVMTTLQVKIAFRIFGRKYVTGV